MQSTRSHPPIKVAPLPDESPTSWLMRICLKYRISFRDFVSIYKLEELMKQPLNITANLSPLAKFLPEGMELPNTIQDKIESFEWKKGRSDWLIHPNKKGSVMHNSYTRICPKCLKEKGYYQLKWQLRIVECCVMHSIRLTEICSKCKAPISSIINGARTQQILNNDLFHKCKKCGFDLRTMKPIIVKNENLSGQCKIDHAYAENPVNSRYLVNIHFSKS